MPHKSADLKLLAVQHYLLTSHRLGETYKIFNCHLMTLYRWVQHFLTYGSFERQHRPSCSYKIRQTHVDEALLYLSLHQTVSIPELHAYLKNKFDDFCITDDHLRRVIRDNNLTRKRTRHGHYPKIRHKNPTNRKADLKAFYSVVSSFPMDKIISIDETSLTPFMFRPYSRCPLGDKCIETTDNNKVFTKHTFVGAISSSRMMGWKLYEEGAMNADRFVEFVRSIITEHHLENHLFLFDNAGAHKGDKIKKLMTETSNRFIYTIPYNPDTNIIENWFSQFKFYIETSKTSTFEELKEDCEKAIGKIREEHYNNYFRYAYHKETYPKRKKPWKSTHRRPPKNYKE